MAQERAWRSSITLRVAGSMMLVKRVQSRKAHFRIVLSPSPPTFNQNNMPETYSTLTDSSQCNPPTDAAKEDAACYDFFGLLGPYAPGYTVNPLDKWGGVEPEDKANCCGPNKDKPFYDVESEGRKRTVIHEAATQFQDPGVQIFDVVDGLDNIHVFQTWQKQHPASQRR